MKMLRILYIVIAISFFSLITPFNIEAKDFSTEVIANYDLDPSGMAKVKHDISLQNETSGFLAESYILNLQSINAKNISVTKDGEQLTFTTEVKEETTKIKIDFKNPIAGKSNKTRFSVNYEIDNFAEKSGEIWEISIPRLSEGNIFKTYDVYLSIPSEFGNEAYISPYALDVKKEQNISTYYFNKAVVEKSGISAGFGEFQVFNFTLNYHLENPLNKVSETEIAIPPDTATQKLYYQKIDPSPNRLVHDDDGNWIATYSLKPRERLDVSVLGAVEIFSTPHHALAPYPGNLLKNTLATDYWQSEDPEIMKLAYELKTPEAIYNYVVSSLSYDYNRVRPNVIRKGAKGVLDNPQEAICMEFTDLFIALSRAAHIPAREINGFAYTENTKIQPLSLVADVLHSWPEYWDENRKTWVPVDPTWGNTTQGVDYFNKLDLRHFAFVVHGISDTKPYPPGSYKLGPNPEKDVFVSFGELPEERSSNLKINFNTKSKVYFFNRKIEVTMENSGQTAIYNVEPTVLVDNEKVEVENIDVLLPFSKHSFPVTLQNGILGTKPQSITVVAGLKVASLPPDTRGTAVMQLIIITLVLLGVILSTLVITGVFRLRKKQQKNVKYTKDQQL